jgi:hypothetical protein
MNSIGTSRLPAPLGRLLFALLLLFCPSVHGQEFARPLRVYVVDQKAADLPADDFSRPERAAAGITRLMVGGGSDAEWARVDYRHREGLAVKLPPEEAVAYRAGTIREVHVYKERIARVIMEVTRRSGQPGFDQRDLVLAGSEWLNAGHDGVANTIENARAAFVRKCEALYRSRLKDLGETVPGVVVRRKVERPEAHLRPLVDFLNREGREPKAFTLDALATHQLVILGEVHHRPDYWAFYASLVADPRFARSVGTIYLELPTNGQPLVEQFLAAPKLDTAPIIRVLREMFEMGFPDQSMLDFFVTVWTVNRGLDRDKHIRIVLVDMQRPWETIQKREDWARYDVDRDKYMADNIVSDLRGIAAGQRHALFIVGHAHVKLNFKYGDGKTYTSDAGSLLTRQLGADSVYAFFPHKPVMTNAGAVHGRLALGLFDSAFAAIGNRPVAFPLSKGPFGEEPYDAEPDNPSAIGSYADGYSAYLYLGPLEKEIFSPLIPGFYTEEHVQEIDRRSRLMYGESFQEMSGQPAANVDNVVEWMKATWGQPQAWTTRLGPMNAWTLGDGWKEIVRQEKQQHAEKHPETLAAAARSMFAAIQQAASKANCRLQLSRTVNYTAGRGYDQWTVWIRTNLGANPIAKVELAEPVARDASPGRLPAIPYTLTLKDGSTLQGVVPMLYDPLTDRWGGYTGLDWHVKR